MPLERFALDPPQAVVLGFFDAPAHGGDAWAPARHAVVRRMLARRVVASLPGALIACAEWGTAEAAEQLAARAQK